MTAAVALVCSRRLAWAFCEAWLNLDLVWAFALITTGIATFVSA